MIDLDLIEKTKNHFRTNLTCEGLEKRRVFQLRQSSSNEDPATFIHFFKLRRQTLRKFRWGIIMQSSPRIHSCKLQIKFQITYNRFVWPYTGLKCHREQFTVSNPVCESFERRSGGKAAILTTLTKLFSGIVEIKTVHSFWMAEEPGYKWVFCTFCRLIFLLS